MGLDNEIFNSFNAINNMKLFGIPTERSDSDPHRVDNYGYRLINICKQASVCIFNSRAGVDKSVGKSTTKFNTVIDYFIGSPELLCKTSSLEVEDFDQELSDVHCGLNCKINIYECKSVDRNTINKNVNNTFNSKSVKKSLWNDNKKSDYVENINMDCIDALLYKINNGENISINSCISAIETTLINGAKKNFQKSHESNSKGNTLNNQKSFKPGPSFLKTKR